jgi:hypothetical protein
MTTTALLPLTWFTNWLAFGERGLSSEAIVTHLTGSAISRWGHGDHPHDPADFRRCVLLLEAVPVAGLTFPTMRDVSREWARLVDAWDEILAELEAEAPGFRDRDAHGRASRTYSLMKRVLAAGAKCEPCDGTGKAEACPKCHGTGRRGGGRCRNAGCADGHFYCRSCRGRGYTGGDR